MQSAVSRRRSSHRFVPLLAFKRRRRTQAEGEAGFTLVVMLAATVIFAGTIRRTCSSVQSDRTAAVHENSEGCPAL